MRASRAFILLAVCYKITVVPTFIIFACLLLDSLVSSGFLFLLHPSKSLVPHKLSTHYKKKIDKSIDFLRGWEEKMVSIFRLRCYEEVEVSLGPNVARSEIYT